MYEVELALERIVGLAPAFMRPPYGNYNDLVRQVSASRNQSRTSESRSQIAFALVLIHPIPMLPVVLWDFDSQDVSLPLTKLHIIRSRANIKLILIVPRRLCLHL